MGSPNQNTIQEPYLTDLIGRYKDRLKTVWQNPNPYIQPLYERSEILTKIKQLQKINDKGKEPR